MATAPTTFDAGAKEARRVALEERQVNDEIIMRQCAQDLQQLAALVMDKLLHDGHTLLRDEKVAFLLAAGDAWDAVRYGAAASSSELAALGPHESLTDDMLPATGDPASVIDEEEMPPSRSSVATTASSATFAPVPAGLRAAAHEARLLELQQQFDMAMQRVRDEHPGASDEDVLLVLIDTDDARFEQLNTMADEIRELAQETTRAVWSAWPEGKWACVYDGAIHGPFETKQEADAEFAAHARSRLGSLSWQVGVTLETLRLDDVTGKPPISLAGESSRSSEPDTSAAGRIPLD